MVFKSVLVEIVIEKMIERYRYKYFSDYLELFMQFENIKCKFKKGYDLNLVIILILFFFLNEECLEILGRDFIILISSLKFKD